MSNLVLNPATHLRHQFSSRECLSFFSGLMLSQSVKVSLMPIKKNQTSIHSTFVFIFVDFCFFFFFVVSSVLKWYKWLPIL